MNPTHIHLLITHLPIFGSILGALVLAQGIWTNSNSAKIAAYYVLIISSVGAGIAYLTGEAAEETVENITGIAENMIEEHEEFALYALISLIILGIAALGGLIITIQRLTLTSTVAKLILFISLISFGLVARTGYLGGQIRHTEIKSNGTLNPAIGGEHDDD